MTLVKKKIIVAIVSFLLVISSMLGVSFASKTNALTTQSVMSSVGGATVEYGQVANVKTVTHKVDKDVDGNIINQETEENEFAAVDGRKGVKLTVNNDSRIRFDANKGIFDLKFKAVSAVGERKITSQPEKLDVDEIIKLDITTVRFDFVSTSNPEDSFYIRFDQIEEGIIQNKLVVRAYYRDVVNTYILFQPSSQGNNPYGVAHLELTNNDYLNKGGTLGMIFNPFDMTVSYSNGNSTQLIVDLNDMASMKKNFATYDTIDRIDEYDVTMSTIVTGESAVVMLYEYNGVSLDGENGESVIVNNAGPIVDTRINNTTGVVGCAYDLHLDQINMYDTIDGYTVFNGDVIIVGPNGENIAHESGIFTPTVAGLYNVKFMPKDSEQVAGQEYVLSINVLSEYPENKFELHYDISDALINANRVKLPGANVICDTLGIYNGEIVVSAKITKNGTLLKEIDDASSDFIVDVTGNDVISVQYFAVDGLGTVHESKIYTLNNNGASINVESVDATYVIDDAVYARNANGTIGHEIISPSGKISSYEKVIVDEIGLWVENYYYEHNGQSCVYSQYFDVVESPANLFVTGRGMTLENNINTPSYFTAQANGIQAVATTPYASATYKNLVNVSEYTKEDTLIQFFPTPLVEGSNEIKEITVTINDPLNSENNLKVELGLHPFYSYQNLGVRVFVGDNMIAPDESYRYYNISGYLGYSTFHGKIITDKGRVYPNNPIGVTLDYKEKVLYVFNDYEYFSVELDNPDTIGKGNEWKGFTSGEAQVSFIYSSITQTAYSLILAVDNLDLSGNVVDDVTAPGVAIDYDMNNLPTAVVGQKFPTMNAYGVDSIDGKINDVKVSVSRIKDGLSFIVPVKADNSFVPTEAGEYVINYLVTDRSGNVGTMDVKIVAVNNLDPLTLDVELKSVYPSAMVLGERFALVPANGKGGSGSVDVKIGVKANGEEIPSNSAFIYPEVVGEYVVVYTLTDYLGQVKEIPHEIQVTRSDKPILSEVVLPEAVMAGKTFAIPERTAVIYTENGKSDVAVETYINGAKVNGSYTPAEYNKEEPQNFNDSFTLTYKAGEYEETATIKVLSTKVNSSVPYLASYFSHDNNISAITDGEQENYLPFSIKQDSKMFFANALSGQELNIKFMLENEHNNIGKINFILQDKLDPAQKIVLSTTKNPDDKKTTGLISINGGMAVDFGGDYTQKSASGVVLSMIGTKLYDADGKLIANLDKTINGEEFNGFTSEYIYLTIEFENVTAASEFNLIAINNQSFNVMVDKDRIAPSIVYFSDFVPTATKDKPYTFVDIMFYDVLDNETSATLLITSPTSEEIYNGEFIRGYTFTPKEYGDYSITIKFEDSGIAKVATKYHIINVADDRVPDLTINGTVQTSASKGSTIKVPSATTDKDFGLFVYVSDPYGATTILYKEYFGADENKEEFKYYEFTAEYSGTYKITYYAYSDGGVYNIKTFNIKVK